MVTFRLLGHDCPTGEYPDVVVPIGECDGALVAAFRSSTGHVIFEALRLGSHFIVHRPALADTLSPFNVYEQSLFARDESNVVAYDHSAEAEFFDSLLIDPERSEDDPFLRLSLACTTRKSDAILNELLRATIRISEEVPEFLAQWYEQRLNELDLDGFDRTNWPRDANSMLALRQEDFPVSARRVLARLSSIQKEAVDCTDRLLQLFSSGGDVETWSLSRLDAMRINRSPAESEVLIVGERADSIRYLLRGLLPESAEVVERLPLEHVVRLKNSGESRARTIPSSDSIELSDPLTLLGLSITAVPLSMGRAYENALNHVDVLVLVVEHDSIASESTLRAMGALNIDAETILCVLRSSEEIVPTPSANWLARFGKKTNERTIVECTKSQVPPKGELVRITSGFASLEESIAKCAGLQRARLLLRRVSESSNSALEYFHQLRSHAFNLERALREQQITAEQFRVRADSHRLAVDRLWRSASDRVSDSLHADIMALSARCVEGVKELVLRWDLSDAVLWRRMVLPNASNRLSASLATMSSAAEDLVRGILEDFVGDLSSTEIPRFATSRATLRFVEEVNANLRSLTDQIYVDDSRLQFPTIVRHSAKLAQSAPLVAAFAVSAVPLMGSVLLLIPFFVDGEILLKRTILDGNESQQGLLATVDARVRDFGIQLERQIRGYFDEILKTATQHIYETVEEQAYDAEVNVSRQMSLREELEFRLRATEDCLLGLKAVGARLQSQMFF